MIFLKSLSCTFVHHFPIVFTIYSLSHRPVQAVPEGAAVHRLLATPNQFPEVRGHGRDQGPIGAAEQRAPRYVCMHAKRVCGIGTAVERTECRAY